MHVHAYVENWRNYKKLRDVEWRSHYSRERAVASLDVYRTTRNNFLSRNSSKCPERPERREEKEEKKGKKKERKKGFFDRGSAHRRERNPIISRRHCYYKCRLIVIESRVREPRIEIFMIDRDDGGALTVICAKRCPFRSKTAMRNNWSAPRIRGN